MISSKKRVWGVAIMVLTTALSIAPLADSSGAAALASAPVARFNSGCGSKLGPCLVFSRGETASMANGDVTLASGVAGPACALAGPFAPVCAGAAAAAGPGMQILSKQARARGQCSAIQFFSDGIVDPLKTRGQVAIFKCPN